MGESVWVLGASMTKIGRYPDKDVIDLAAEADVRRARRRRRLHLRHAGPRGREHVQPGRHRPGRSRSRSARPASRSTTWSTRAPPAPPRCARPTSRSRRARPTWVSRSVPSRWARWGSSPEPGAWHGSRLRAGRPLRGRHARRRLARLGHDARGVRPGRHGVRLQARRRRLRAVRQGRREEPRALGAQPARAVPEGLLARGDHERPRDLVPEHAADVLPDR